MNAAVISTTDIIARLILEALASVQAMVELQARARAEGRDVSAAELAALRASDLAVRQHLDAAIAAHGGN